MKLGILGGTFDPIHFGHLRAAEEVAEVLELEKTYLIPAALPPHKETRPITAFHHRLAMTRLAAEDSPILEAMDLEGRRQGLSYSIETLKEFHKLFEPDLTLFFILGMDAFLEIETWKEYDRLFDYANFVVIKRPGIQYTELEPFLRTLGLGLKREGKGNEFVHKSGSRLIYREVTVMDISSTRIRKMVGTGKSIRFLVPKAVMSYMIEKELYRIHGSPR